MGTPYTSQSASGYNASPPPDDGSTSANNKITWSGIKTKLADVLNTFTAAINTQLVTALRVDATTQSSAYTTTTADHLRTIEVTGTTTISLGSAVTMAAASMGYTVPIVNTGTAVVTVALITNTDTLDGTVNGTTTLQPGQSKTFTVDNAQTGYETIGSANGTHAIALAISDETTAITTGTAKITFRMPYKFTINYVRASLSTVSSSGNPTFDIKETGVSIFSTKISIDANEKTSTTAAVPYVLSDTSLADDAEMTVDITTAGTGATGAKIYIVGRPA